MASLPSVVTSESPAVRQFRNVPYARVTRRFDPPLLVNTVTSSEKHGPRCPQVQFDLSSLFRRERGWEEPEDEKDCLNLCVTAPADVTEASKLPVLVFVHGGSFVATVGSPGTSTADPTLLVSTSIALGTPTIVVNINYRVGLLGFLRLSASSANAGIHDQRTALHWIQKHIHVFGGDAARVTLGGESAGAIACHYHLLTSEAGLFHRVIMMSGHVFTIHPQPPSVCDSITARVCKHLNTTDASTLRDIPVETILKAQSDLALNGFFASDEILSGVNSSTVSLPSWCEAAMIGDAAFESNLWARAISALPTTESVISLFPPSPASTKILDTYGITPTTAVDVAKRRTLDFLADAKFSAYTHRLAEAWAENNPEKLVCRYQFNLPSPHDASAGAHHAADLLWLFAETGEKGEEMRRCWVEFVVGGEGAGRGRPKTVIFGEDIGRRVTEFEVLIRMQESGELQEVVRVVTAGRTSFQT